MVTAGGRHSLQLEITATIAHAVKKPLQIICPLGELGEELVKAKELGAEITQINMGFTNVLCAKARKEAQNKNWDYVPWGLECCEAIKQTGSQVDNLPEDIKRLIVPIGSGMSLCGILNGLRRIKRKIPILAILVGSNPVRRLDNYAPKDWRTHVEIIKPDLKYNKEAKNCSIGDVLLDPFYESKCIEYLEKDDCLWIVGCRKK